jgi:hypothetical protein
MATLQLMAQPHPSPINLKTRMAMMQTSRLYLQSLYLTDIRSEYPYFYPCLDRRSTQCHSSAPYQLHNEEIVNHLYHAGFQTGVSTCVFM